MRCFIILIFNFILIQYSYSQSGIQSNETKKRFEVGFDYFNVLREEKQISPGKRQINVFVWFPTKAPNNSKMIPYRDFLIYGNSQIDQSNFTEEQKNQMLDSLIAREVGKLSESYKGQIFKEKYRELISNSILRSKPSSEKFPLIILGPGGNSTPLLHVLLAEFLASNGYIVVALNSTGLNSGEPWPFDTNGLEIQIADTKAVVDYFRSQKKFKLDSNPTGLIAWSVGGVSQVLYADKFKNSGYFISLDSGVGRAYGVEMLLNYQTFSMKNFTMPYLHLTGQQPEIYQVERSSEFYDSISSSIKSVEFIPSFSHQHFASHIGIIPELVTDDPDEMILSGYNEMCDKILSFIQSIENK